VNEAVRAYSRAWLRSSWRRRLALVLAVGVVGAVAIGAAAGAERTGSAVDRFLVEQRAFDFVRFCGPPQSLGGGYDCERAVQGLDGVADTATLLTLRGFMSSGGRSIDPNEDTCYSGPGDAQLVVSPDGRYGTAINTHRFIAGRPADPSRAEEVVITRELARSKGIGVGDTIDVQLFAGADCLDDPSRWRPARALTVVGIEVAPIEVRPESGDFLSFVYGTPALLAEAGDLTDQELMVAARLEPGGSLDDAAVERLGGLAGGASGDGAVLFASVNADNLRRSARPYVIAQWLVCAVLAGVGLIIFGQMLSRQIRSSAGELRGLAQLGLTRADLSAVALVHLLSVVVPAALVSVVGGYLASALTPLGVARIVEVHRGLRLDAIVLVAGGQLMIAGLVVAAIPSVVGVVRRRALSAKATSGRAGTLARRMGGGPVTTTGVRLAFEPLRGPLAPPLRTGFGMVLSAVVLLVGATVFAGSLTHLLAADHLIGWNWDAVMYVEPSEDAAPISSQRVRDVLADTPGVTAATLGTLWAPARVLLGPNRVEVLVLSSAGGPIGPTLISGRAPRGAEEIVLGRETLSRLGYHEGDRVPTVTVVGDFEEIDRGGGTEVPRQVTIVGTGVLPAGGGDTRLGTGGFVDFEFFRAVVPDARPGVVYVRVESPDRLAAVGATAARRLGIERVDMITADFLGPVFLDVAQVRNLPLALAAMLMLLAVGVVAQVMISSTNARRGELGVLRALGLRPRQIRMALVVQAVAFTGSVLLVGIPLGIALGRGVWSAFALSLGTKPEVDLAVAWLAGSAVGLVGLASLIGLIGSTAQRQCAAAALRTE